MELSIGQMAKMNNISEKALRRYHDYGLLHPSRIDGQTGYRYYSVEQSMIVDTIRRLQFMGFSFEEIKRIQDSQDITLLRDLLQDHYSSIEHRRAQFARASAMAEDYLRRADLLLDEPMRHEVMLEYIPARSVVRFDADVFSEPYVIDEEGVFSVAGLESAYQRIKQDLANRGWIAEMYRNVATCISREALLARNLHYTGAVLLGGAEMAEIEDQISWLPAGEHLVMFCGGGGYPTEDNPEYRNVAKMLDFAEEHGFTVVGDYIGETVLDVVAFSMLSGSSLFKMTIPVKRTVN